ncbi:MAG: amino acid transporter, partial [Actinobacteria bacterium]|nr:amino acid transporter [Actinomycetota bacterium]
LYIAADGRLSLWEGGPLEPHRHENNVWARRSPGDPWSFDLTVGEGDQHVWIYRRDRSVTRPWEEAVFRTSSGVPYLAPELQLLFKSKHHQPKDNLDAERVIPALGPTEQAFLAAQIGVDHPWQRLLTS